MENEEIRKRAFLDGVNWDEILNCGEEPNKTGEPKNEPQQDIWQQYKDIIEGIEGK